MLWCCGPLTARRNNCYCANVNDRLVYIYIYVYTFETCVWVWGMLENTALYASLCSFMSFISAMSVFRTVFDIETEATEAAVGCRIFTYLHSISFQLQLQ